MIWKILGTIGVFILSSALWFTQVSWNKRSLLIFLLAAILALVGIWVK